MKNPQKYLRAARNLEVRQVARKTPEIADVYAFDLQHDHARQEQFDAMLADEERLRVIRQAAFGPFQDIEAERVDRHTDDMLSARAFEDEALVSQQYGEDNAFEIIAAMLGFDFEERRPHTVKHLPAASNVFENSLTDVIESHLEEELTHNQQAITPWKEKVRSALIRHEEPASAQKKTAQPSPSGNVADQELSEEQITAALRQEEELEKTQPADSVFFFRPPTTPKMP